MYGRFRDRRQAGRLLAHRLEGYASRRDTVVLALPRGGVPVGFEVARGLHAPLDVFVVRKLGIPGNEEVAMGAIAGGGVRVVDWSTVEAHKISEEQVQAVTRRELAELARREDCYRFEGPRPQVSGRIAILVDDGLATGATMRAAVSALRAQLPARIIVAVPICEPGTAEEIAAEVDEIVCAVKPERFYAVAFWYEDFSQTTDMEVRELLRTAAKSDSIRAPNPHG